MAPRSLLLALLLPLGGCNLSALDPSPANKVSVDYYSISGDSTAALDADIRKRGPRLGGGSHAVAVARIQMVPKIEYAGNCRIRRATVKVNARVTLPRWTGRANADSELGAAWDNIERYTRLHEAVHVATAFRFAKRLEQDLLALPTTNDCATLRQMAKTLVQTTLERHDEAQLAFDASEQRRFASYDGADQL